MESCSGILMIIILSVSTVAFIYFMGKIIKDLFKNNGHGP
jgi:hypothetical protein